jgi:hypothetical protein
MDDTYTFEHDGHTVTYVPTTVRAQLRRNRYLVALITFYGYPDGETAAAQNPEEWDNYKEYSDGMSQCTTTAPWWVVSTSTPEQVAAAYELFMHQGPELYFKFVSANIATQPPKKTTEVT